MSTPSQKVKLYYKVVGDNLLKLFVRWLASKLGYVCLPARYLISLENHAKHANEQITVKNPVKKLQLAAKAAVYSEIYEEIKAFKEHKYKEKQN